MADSTEADPQVQDGGLMNRRGGNSQTAEILLYSSSCVITVQIYLHVVDNQRITKLYFRSSPTFSFDYHGFYLTNAVEIIYGQFHAHASLEHMVRSTISNSSFAFTKIMVILVFYVTFFKSLIRPSCHKGHKCTYRIKVLLYCDHS